MDGWTGRWEDRQTDIRTDFQLLGQTDRQMAGRTGRGTDRQVGSRISGQTDGWLARRADSRPGGLNDQPAGRTDRQTAGWATLRPAKRPAQRAVGEQEATPSHFPTPKGLDHHPDTPILPWGWEGTPPPIPPRTWGGVNPVLGTPYTHTHPPSAPVPMSGVVPMIGGAGFSRLPRIPSAFPLGHQSPNRSPGDGETPTGHARPATAPTGRPTALDSSRRRHGLLFIPGINIPKPPALSFPTRRAGPVLLLRQVSPSPTARTTGVATRDGCRDEGWMPRGGVGKQASGDPPPLGGCFLRVGSIRPQALSPRGVALVWMGLGGNALRIPV